MRAKEIFDALVVRFGDVVRDFSDASVTTGQPDAAPAKGEVVRDAFCKVKAASWVEVATFLRDDPTLAFDFLQNLTAVDWIKQDLMQTVYHFYSYTHRHSFVVKIDVPRADSVIPSVVSLWPTANWLEREQYDLLGVRYSGHPDLRRLLLPDDWVGHPMRKDYTEAAQYRGMPTNRYSPLDLLLAYDKEHPQKEGERPGAGGGTSAKESKE